MDAGAIASAVIGALVDALPEIRQASLGGLLAPESVASMPLRLPAILAGEARQKVRRLDSASSEAGVEIPLYLVLQGGAEGGQEMLASLLEAVSGQDFGLDIRPIEVLRAGRVKAPRGMELYEVALVSGYDLMHEQDHGGGG